MAEENVTEKDLRKMFKALIGDLTDKIESGEATGKDKELALKLVDAFNIGITLDDTKRFESLLGEALPFNEITPQ